MCLLGAYFQKYSSRKVRQEIPDVTDISGKITLLNQFSSKFPFTKVTCEAKVLKMSEVVETASRQKTLKCFFGDSSDIAKFIP